MKQYELFELEFTADAPRGSWAAVDLYAEFSASGGTVTVNGFVAETASGVTDVSLLGKEGIAVLAIAQD